MSPPIPTTASRNTQGPELEDRFGTGQAPPGAGEIHAVLDEMPAGALDHAGSDRPALGEHVRVVEVVGLVDQVGGGPAALIRRRASSPLRVARRRIPTAT
jgi:hypothetical protein